MQKPIPPRLRSKSADNLEEVKALDAAESRATMALRLMNDERVAREAAEAEVQRLRADAAQRELEAARAVQPRVELAPESKASMRPGVLSVQVKGLKIGIPLALLTPVLALVWAGYQNYTDMQRQVKAMQVILANRDTRVDSLETRVSEQSKEIAILRETQASQAGYLTGVLPMAGVKVPGTGSPIQSDPLPAGARRQTPVNVRTPVPTPPSK